MSSDRFTLLEFLPRVRLSDGGIVRAVLDWCQAFSRQHNVILVTASPEDVPDEWLHHQTPGLRVVQVSMCSQLLTRRALMHITSELPPVSMAHLHQPWLLANYQLAGLCRRHRIPYTVSTHGTLDPWPLSQKRVKKHVYLALAGKRLLRNASMVHTTAEAEAGYVEAAAGAQSHLVTIPYLLQLGDYWEDAHRRAVDPTTFTVLFMSRLHPKKGIPHLLEAFSRFAQETRTQLLIAGEGLDEYERQLEEQVRDLGIVDKVEFLGHVAGEAKHALLRRSDVLVLPTHQENFGIALVEAMAAGVPIMTTEHVDIWRELQMGGALILEKPETSAIVRALRELAAVSPSRRLALGLRGAEHVRDWLDARHNEKRYLDEFIRSG